jgi:uncharacterized protein YhaN
MRITGIRVPGRAGQALCINGLGPGLSVIYGPNGSGKTTLLDALRAILCGFDERALRRWRTTGGPCGPAISTHWRGAEYRVVRVPRTGHPDTLALRFQHGDVAAAAELRRELTAAVPVAVAAALHRPARPVGWRAGGDGTPL